ncbi:MAG: hypothetical protein B7Z66_15380 [Chromatiales bacterium 21-64-14]|nr:MAG: hypothetical protein B7Z66_15380 [Chromatiales bacterium 21-64-14]
MRIALYARYSTDMQRDASIHDQFRNCMRFISTRVDWHVVRRDFDEGISGSKSDRPGYQELLAAGKRDEYDLIVVDEVSRLWRDQEEQWRAVNRLRYIGVNIIGVSDGIDTRREGFELLLAIHGAINESERKKIAYRTHRGLTGQAEKGASCGGRSYGYGSITIEDPVRKDPHGRPQVQECRKVIVPEEAAVVRHIFQWFSEGQSPFAIADRLNTKGIPAPRGGKWARSAIYGDRRTGVGILNNVLYRGLMVWNRSKWVRNPDTGRRKRVERDQCEWITVEQPALRIIDDDLWRRVQARLHRGDRRGVAVKAGITRARKSGGRYPRYLLSGLLQCSVCGGKYTVVDRYRYGCATHKERGSHACTNHLKVSRALADKLLLQGLREQLLTQERLRLFERETARLIVKAQKNSGPDTIAVRRRLKSLEKEIANLTGAIRELGISPALRDELRAAEQEKERIGNELDTAEAEVPDLPKVLPLAAQRFRELVSDLVATLARDLPRARALLEELLPNPIRLIPQTGGWLEAEVGTDLDTLLRISGKKLLKNQEYLTLVAGAGFEPATFGL